MRPPRVVFRAPGCDLRAGVEQIPEPAYVQTFVAQPSVEALNVRVLRWLARLDVVFAGYYFRAVAAFVSGAADAPNAWDALMEARYRTGIDRIQFALAGMNAHINHDLALALLETDGQMNVVPSLDSPQHVDYEAVNGLLRAVMPAELTMLATDALGQLAQDTGKVGRLLAFWDVCKARDLAWDFSNHLRGLQGPARQVGLSAQDQVTGVLGRAILVCA